MFQGPNYKHYAGFDVFRLDRDFINNTCIGTDSNVCKWTVKEDGVYVRNRKFAYRWDTPNQQITPVSAPASEPEFDSEAS